MTKFTLTNLLPEQKKLRKRILEISYESSLSHIGSCFTAVDLIHGIYKVKKINDKFILSNGHAGIAWYAVLEKYGFIKDPQTTNSLNLHPDRNPAIDIHVSTGSLGQGLPIALGLALADKKSNIYCMLSDGECAEGSVWEALSCAYIYNVTNLKIIINANGWSAYDAVNLRYLKRRLKAFGFTVTTINGHNLDEIIQSIKLTRKTGLHVIFAVTTVEQLPFLKGQDAHYHVMTDEEYQKALELL